MNVSIKNRDSNLKKGVRALLTYDHDCLVPCSIDEREDGFDFCFNISELSPIQDADKISTANKKIEESQSSMARRVSSEISSLSSRLTSLQASDRAYHAWVAAQAAAAAASGGSSSSKGGKKK